MATHRNRLAAASSPYLLQHADNPVDWYPWGPEALDKARREDKPILLSIGYAACHWCHVMAHESFEDKATAQRMNEHFVNIKVDREERPDLDHIYQLVVQLMGRNGGWPLTVFLTPDQRPFFAGTYFPPHDRYGMPSFSKVLHALADAYRNRRHEVAEQAQELTAEIARVGQTRAEAGELSHEALATAARQLQARFDPHHGGFGHRPKFPNTMALEVLLRRGVLEGDAVARRSVALALDGMRAGGIWDHLRGGFHRYSTDEHWLVPHFEKMLYDNALLLRLYVDGYRVYGTPRYAETARAIVGYLFAEMRSSTGAFFASQDADSEGHEGRFFVFTPADLRAALEGQQTLIEVAERTFGITPAGNFENSGATVLSEVTPIETVAAALGLERTVAEARQQEAQQRMLAYREARPRPARDDKLLASWNGLLIGALAEAGRALEEPRWVRAAEDAFAAIDQRLVRQGRVGRYSMEAKATPEGPGFLDDQAYLGNAALDLYEATGHPRYATTALAIAQAMLQHHWDQAQGGFYFAPNDGEPLIARTKDAYDQAIPSGVSMAALLCQRLGTLSNASLLEAGERQLALIANAAVHTPFGMSQAVLGIDRAARGCTDVVVVGPRDEAERLVAEVYRHYLPCRTIAWVDPNDAESLAVAKVAAEGKSPPTETGKAVAYVCKDRTCSPPVRTPEELRTLLQT